MARKAEYISRVNVVVSRQCREVLEGIARQHEMSLGCVVRMAIDAGMDATIAALPVPGRDQ